MFVIANPEYAKRLAKSVEANLHEIGMDVGRKAALNLLSNLWGYRDFPHVLSAGISSSPSRYDDECDEAEKASRREVQFAALRNFGVKDKLIPEFLAKVRPTDRRTKPREEGSFSTDQVPEIVSLARKAEELGDTSSAAMILVDALRDSDRRQKGEVVAELKRLSVLEPTACYNLGLAFVIGDAGERNLDAAATHLHACCAFGRGDRVHALSLTVLGDIEGLKVPNRTGVTEASLKFYRQAAITGHSPESAFNCGLFYERKGDDSLAAEFYSIAIEAKHPQAMTNLAFMIRDGRYDGGSKLMRALFASAAAQGDGAAHNAMRIIDRLAIHVDFPEISKSHDEFSKRAHRHPVFAQDLVQVIPVRQWIKVLGDKGWKLISVNTKMSTDMERIATALGNHEREIPVHMTCAPHAVGHRDPDLLKAFENTYGDQDAILISNNILVLNETDNPMERYLCIGMIRTGKEWSDLFLEEGGLDVALKQRVALATNPNLNKGKTFRCDDAAQIEHLLKEATLKNIGKL